MKRSYPLLFVILLINFLPHNCILVITSEMNKRPQPDAHFIIPGLNLSSLDTFTMCGRFNVHQFIVQSSVVDGKYKYETYKELIQGVFPGFGTFSLVSCDDTICNGQIIGADRKWKHVFQYTYLFGQLNASPTSVKPNEWNSFCLKVNRTTSIIKHNQDVLISHKNDKIYVPAFFRHKIFPFMNEFDLMSPMHGAFTDVHVWDKILSIKEEYDWMNCHLRKEGNLISWNNSSQQVQMTGLKSVNESLENICPDQNSNLVVGNETLDFFQTLNYCSKIGKMAEITSNETAIQINETLGPYFDYWTIFTGYSDVEVEGQWVHHITDHKMTWDNWNPGEPNSWGGDEDCAAMRSNLKLYDYPCSTKFKTSVCNMDEV